MQILGIDSDPIIVLLFVTLLCLVMKNCKFMNIFTLRKLDETQLMRHCVIIIVNQL